MLQKRKLLCLLFISAPLYAKHLTFKPKAGVQLSQLHLASKDSQKQPVLEVENPVFLAESNTQMAANSFLFNATGNRGLISKDNIDGAFTTHAMLGLQIGVSGEPERPHTSFSCSPVLNIYGLLEDQKKHATQTDRFVISPLTTGGADIGLELAKNGSHLQLGVGGQLFRCNYETGLLFSAMATVKSTTVSNLDTTSLQATDKKPYKASIDPFILPYLYADFNTEIGDLTSIFMKLSYGFKTSPRFKNTNPTLEMFSKDPSGYAANSEWQLNSVTIGAKVRAEDLF